MHPTLASEAAHCQPLAAEAPRVQVRSPRCRRSPIRRRPRLMKPGRSPARPRSPVKANPLAGQLAEVKRQLRAEHMENLKFRAKLAVQPVKTETAALERPTL